MDVATLLVTAASCGWFAGVARWWRSPAQRWQRALLAAPRVRIADHVDGTMVRLTGHIVSAPPVTAPLSGRPGVFCVTTVLVPARGTWATVVCEASPASFVIDDGSGHARIDTTDALCAFAANDPVRDAPFYPSGPDVDALLARHRRSPGLGRVRASERILAIGDRIEVCGLPVREADPDGASRVTGYRDLPPTRLALVSAPRRPLLLGDPR